MENPYQFLKFLAAGATSAVVTLYVRHVLNLYVMFEVAVVVSQVVGTIVAFILARTFVFAGGANPVAQYIRFVIVNCGSLLITTSVSALFYRVVLPAANYSFYPELTAHFIALASSAVPSFFGHKYFSFRESRQQTG